MKNLFVCIITLENDEKQYLTRCFLKNLFIKELVLSIVVHTFFNLARNTEDETGATFEPIH